MYGGYPGFGETTTSPGSMNASGRWNTASLLPIVALTCSAPVSSTPKRRPIHAAHASRNEAEPMYDG